MRIGFIGVGNMGGAILKGAIRSGFIQTNQVSIFDKNPETINTITNEFSVKVEKNSQELTEVCDVIILGVKPIILNSVLSEISSFSSNKVIISIAAGWSLTMLINALDNKEAQIVRVMPNTPALVSAGFTAICEESTFTPSTKEWVINLLSCLGMVSVLSETAIDAVIAVSGSSPAYVFMFIDALADGAVKQGMSRQLAIQAAAQAVLGSAKMVLDTQIHPSELKDQVCSPGGTTIEAVATLEKNGFKGAVISAMENCANKSKIMQTELELKWRK